VWRDVEVGAGVSANGLIGASVGFGFGFWFGDPVKVGS